MCVNERTIARKRDNACVCVCVCVCVCLCAHYIENYIGCVFVDFPSPLVKHLAGHRSITVIKTGGRA